MKNKIYSIDKIKSQAKGFKRVESMSSPSYNGGTVANQTIIYFNNMEIFQSYNSIIAIKKYVEGKNAEIYLGDNWDYSMTTGKYRNQFLREEKKDTQKKIDSGEYKLMQ